VGREEKKRATVGNVEPQSHSTSYHQLSRKKKGGGDVNEKKEGKKKKKGKYLGGEDNARTEGLAEE